MSETYVEIICGLSSQFQIFPKQTFKTCITNCLNLIWIFESLKSVSEAPLLIFSLSKSRDQYKMLSSGIYLLQVQVRKIRNAIIAAGNYIITLRVGKNSSTYNFTRTGSDKQVQINARLQMNVDKSALQAQRCSLSITSEDKKMIGLALVSIPQEMSTLSNTYKLTQNEDKRAQIQLKLKLSPFEGIRIQINRVKQQPIEPNGNDKNLFLNQGKDNNGLMSKISKLDLLPSYINLKSNISDQPSHISSQQRPQLKNFKLIEEEKLITVSQSEIKRFRDEKQVYYQLYQIQKTKSQVALKFITAISKKLSNKYPNLVQQIEDSQPKIFVVEQRKNSRQNTHLHQQQSNQAHIQQLQQANRSLHRQVQQYKKIVEQLKEELSRAGSKGQHKKASSTISKQNKILPDFLDLSFSRGEKEKSPRKNRESHQQLSISESLKGIDFKQWLQVSIGERKALQTMFLSLEPYQNSTLAFDAKALSTKIKQQLFQNMKSKIDKQFITLLKIKQLNKQILINHRKQLNKLLQQCFLQ